MLHANVQEVRGGSLQFKHTSLPVVPDISNCARIRDWLAFERGRLKKQNFSSRGELVDPEFFVSRVADPEALAHLQEKYFPSISAKSMRSLESANPRITPIRHALDVWSLTAEDIGVLSIHSISIQTTEKTTRTLEHIF